MNWKSAEDKFIDDLEVSENFKKLYRLDNAYQEKLRLNMEYLEYLAEDSSIADRLESCHSYDGEDVKTVLKLRKNILTRYKKMREIMREIEKISMEIISDMENEK